MQNEGKSLRSFWCYISLGPSVDSQDYIQINKKSKYLLMLHSFKFLQILDTAGHSDNKEARYNIYKIPDLAVNIQPINTDQGFQTSGPNSNEKWALVKSDHC